MYQFVNMEPQFQQILLKRVLELKTRLNHDIEDGNISSSLIKDLSALLKWGAKIGLLGESDVKNVQYNLNIVRKCTNHTINESTSSELMDIRIKNQQKARSQLPGLMFENSPKCLIEMTSQNRSTQTDNKQINNLQEESPSNVILIAERKKFTSSKNKFTKRTRNIFQRQHRMIRTNNPANNTSTKSSIGTKKSTDGSRISEANKNQGNNKLSRNQRNFKSTNCMSSNRYVLTYKDKFVDTNSKILSNQKLYDRGKKLSIDLLTRKWKYKSTPHKYVLPCKIVGQFQNYKLQTRFYDLGKKKHSYNK